MLLLRKSQDRGFADHGWLKSWHSFSFASYYDSRYMGFRQLRVINQDIVAPGEGFPTHGHSDMEIITVVLRGTIEHKDSLGNKEQIKAGEIQRMSAGTGVRHSEYNPSASEDLELLQIWIEPAQKGLPPSYEQAWMKKTEGQAFSLLAAPEGEGGAVKIHQNVKLWRADWTRDFGAALPIQETRHAWVQVISGKVLVCGQELLAGDGLALSREQAPTAKALGEDASFLLFDLF